MQPGQISDLVKSQYGFHIIKVVDKKAAVTRPLAEVQAQIRDQLAAQKTDQEITTRASQLQERIKKPSDLDAAAKEAGVPVQESGFFQREDPVPGLGAAPAVTAAAFRLKENDVSEPVASARGPVIFVVTQKKDPYVPKLDEVKEKVRQDVIRTRAAEMSRQRAGEIAAALKGAKDFAAAAKAQGLEAKTTEMIMRGAALPDIGTSAEVDKVAFSLPAGAVSDPIATNDGTAIIRVVERDEVTPEEFRSAKDQFRAELLNERRARFFSAYMTKAKEKTKIEVKNDVVRRLTAARI
jgi:peptidyl-prolyl cis-trans isomerase D